MRNVKINARYLSKGNGLQPISVVEIGSSTSTAGTPTNSPTPGYSRR